MSTPKKIVLLPGDGIGPEVVAEAERVINAVVKAFPSIKWEITSHPFGGAAMDLTGDPLPDSTFKACKEADAVLMGSVGGPKWGWGPVRPELGMLKLRKTLDCYANIRPALFPSPSLVSKSPLKEEYAKGTSIVLIRELVGGIYFGARQEADFTQPNAHAWDRAEYSVDEVVRIARVAGHLAMKTNPPTPVHSIDKANVLATSRVWRYAVTKTFAEEFPTVPLDHTLVDAAAMLLAAKPKKLNGIIVTDNIFGDILSDEIAVISGSIGVLPSASLNGPPDGSGTTFGLYEPIHGSAPDIMGRGISNPIGTILSVAMMYRYSFNMEAVAAAIEQAVSIALDYKKDGGHEVWTGDLGGTAMTKDVGDKVILTLEPLLKKITL